MAVDLCTAMRTKFDLYDVDSKELTNEETTGMQKHFEDCAPCQTWLAKWELLRVAAKQIEEVPVPAGLTERIVASIEKERSTVPISRELAFAFGCFAIFMALIAVFGQDTAQELLTWCACFVILIFAQRICSTMQPGEAV
jgi:anti-sigma factor RsiW